MRGSQESKRKKSLPCGFIGLKVLNRGKEVNGRESERYGDGTGKRSRLPPEFPPSYQGIAFYFCFPVYTVISLVSSLSLRPLEFSKSYLTVVFDHAKNTQTCWVLICPVSPYGGLVKILRHYGRTKTLYVA